MKFTTKQKRLIWGIGFSSLIIIFALFAVPFSPTFLGGTSWGFDYQIAELTINGEVQEEALEGAPDSTNYERGTDGDIGILPNVIPLGDVRTSYEWWVDVDGAPLYTGYAWSGLLPDLGVTLSLPWRVNALGNPIPTQAEDPDSPAFTVGDEIHKLYYYAFDVMVKTAQSQFTVPSLIPWQSAECGVMDVDTVVTVAMLKRFSDDVIGEFMDAKVLDVELMDLQLQSGLAWEVVPSMAVKQDINQGIPIQNRDEHPDLYTCDLMFTCTLTPGLSRSGDNLLPYDVYVRKVVQVSLLLKAPLTIGETGEPQDPFDPPVFIPPMDLFTMIIIVLGFVLAIIVLIVVFRVVGVIGLFKRATKD